MKALIALLAAGVVSAGSLPFRQSAFTPAQDGKPSGWTTWAARSEIAPRTFVDAVHSRNEGGSLAISGDSNAAEYGGWERTIDGIEAGKWYRFVAYYRGEGLEYEPLQVLARLSWFTAAGKNAGRPDYPYRISNEGEWRRLTMDLPAPEKAEKVTLQLYLQNAPYATVWWDDISFEEIPAPAPRKVTVASINYRPRTKTGSTAENVRRFIETANAAVPQQTDIILMPEGMPVVDTGIEYAKAAEPIPGPITKQLGEFAKTRKSYVVAGMYEREGPAVYNTAVLIDREGRVAGKYRKVYIPREEIEAGITPGKDYPVFRTDFGTIGMMICWDSQYPEPARNLTLRGAEMILLPIWDGELTLMKARAIENNVFVVTSSYGSPTQIIDPKGEQVALAPKIGTAAVATIDLNRRYLDPWLGDMRARAIKEFRGDIPFERPQLGESGR